VPASVDSEEAWQAKRKRVKCGRVRREERGAGGEGRWKGVQDGKGDMLVTVWVEVVLLDRVGLD
jgi:hypothetical protein